MDRGCIRELDLRKCGPGSVAERVGFVPGLRSSAAFFTCLRANLVLSPSVLASNFNTPYLEPYAAQPAHAQPSPCSTVVSESLVPLDDIPPLSLEALTTQHERAEGLQLVADSVSEMGPCAAKAVILHPLSLAALASSWVAIYRLVYMADMEDASRALMLASGLTMLYLASVRFVSSSYATLADDMDQDWLRADYGGQDDLVLGVKSGSLLVGALVLRLEPNRRSASSTPSKRKNRSRSASLKGGKGIIRAWATTPSHRGGGVGKQLLDEAVRYTKDKCGKDAQVGFAREHAHSVMVLPGLFNAGFRRNEARAARALDASVGEWDFTKKKR
ncbi:hypothetical protein E4U42_004425 [Claviceps africana]|uniref:N-acetyltransferase domain-containing protein n=1 Tax=Claviceps africana TaxID=83212 RepID=A0A8K0J5V9_9HYPO|nr:hypothetical protein E4U42_004425 [Claviceps africana]